MLKRKHCDTSMCVPILKASSSLKRGIRNQEQIHPEKRPPGEAALQYKGLPSPSSPALLTRKKTGTRPSGQDGKTTNPSFLSTYFYGQETQEQPLTSMECFTKDLV